MGLLDNLFSGGSSNDPAEDQWKRAALEELIARVHSAPAPNNDPAEPRPYTNELTFAPAGRRGVIPRPVPFLGPETTAPATAEPSAPSASSAPMPMAPPTSPTPWETTTTPERTVTDRPIASTPYAPPPPKPEVGGGSGVPGAGGISAGTGERKVRETNMWDRMTALSRGYASGGLIGGIADAANLDNVKDDAKAEQNATIRALTAKIGDPDLARTISRDPDLMKVVMQNVLAPKAGDWKHVEYTDPATDRKISALYNAHDGRRIVLGDGKGEPLPAELAAKVGQIKNATQLIKKSRGIFDRELSPIEIAQLGASGTPVVGDVASVSGEVGRAARDIRTAAEAALRVASGAAVPDSEVKRYTEFYMPTVTDNAASRKQKIDNLQGFLDEIADAAGRNRIGTLTPEEVRGIHERRAGRTSGAAPSASGGAAPSAPAPGSVVKGYRFKGGDPASRDSWERAS